MNEVAEIGRAFLPEPVQLRQLVVASHVVQLSPNLMFVLAEATGSQASCKFSKAVVDLARVQDVRVSGQWWGGSGGGEAAKMEFGFKRARVASELVAMLGKARGSSMNVQAYMRGQGFEIELRKFTPSIVRIIQARLVDGAPHSTAHGGESLLDQRVCNVAVELSDVARLNIIGGENGPGYVGGNDPAA